MSLGACFQMRNIVIVSLCLGLEKVEILSSYLVNVQLLIELLSFLLEVSL